MDYSLQFVALLCAAAIFQNVVAQQQQQPVTRKNNGNLSEFEDEGGFCVPQPGRRIFTRSTLDGAVCCKGQILPAATVLPEIEGDCAISTKTDENGILHPSSLWCAYTCTLKKLGLMDAQGSTKPAEFFGHLSNGLGPTTKDQLKTIMTKHFKCMQPIKNPKFPCYTPLGFHKCYVDALEYLCTKGYPKDGDFSKIPAPKVDYVNMQPTCESGGRQVMPACCHGRPLPWTIPDIIEAPRNRTKMKSCMVNMNNRVCAATCFMNSAGVVDDSMELDVEQFEKTILGLFPVVKPSMWMNFLAPTFLFFDETLEEMGAPLSTAARVCLFHDKILNFHEDKIQQYCEMTPAEVKQILNKQ